MSPQLTAWLFDSIVLFIQISVAAVWLFGLLLVIAPSRALSLQHRLNIRFSGRKIARPLEVPVNIDRYFYRHARPVGVVLMLGAIGLLVLNGQLPGHVQANTPAVWAWLAESLFWFLWIAGMAIFFIGLACVVRPSLLKPLETRANQWVSTRQKSRVLSQEFNPLDHLLQQNPRLMGLVIAAISSILLLILIRA
ncbi:MAG: hypothetical protein R6X06_11240 [Gammaproteobacteria bacterium]